MFLCDAMVLVFSLTSGFLFYLTVFGYIRRYVVFSACVNFENVEYRAWELVGMMRSRFNAVDLAGD